MAKITFLCPPDTAPIEMEQLLRELGIRVTRRSWVKLEHGTEATIHVPNGQQTWGAGLIAGQGIAVLEPAGVKPIKQPKQSWGAPVRSYGPQSLAVAGLEAMLGADNRYKDRYRGSGKIERTRPTKPPKPRSTKRKLKDGGKGLLLRRAWDKLSGDL